MAERFTADLLFIVVVLLIAALIGFLIGWLLERRRCNKLIALKDGEIEGLNASIRKLEEEKKDLIIKISDIEKERLSLRDRNRELDDEIASLKLTIDRLEKEAKALKEAQAEALKAKQGGGTPEPLLATMDQEAPVAPPREFKTDDLEVVVGIGPKIAGLLIARGITTWKKLAETSPDYLKEILDKDGGERFRVHNPGSWPHQAQLLHEGRWDEFRELENRLEGEKA
jgi:predicted flap endonuclease-1-like 5' DNA nuclease